MRSSTSTLIICLPATRTLARMFPTRNTMKRSPRKRWQRRNGFLCFLRIITRNCWRTRPMGDPWLQKFKEEVLPQIVAEFSPTLVLLFGSRVRGTAEEDADVDVVIVS